MVLSKHINLICIKSTFSHWKNRHTKIVSHQWKIMCRKHSGLWVTTNCSIKLVFMQIRLLAFISTQNRISGSGCWCCFCFCYYVSPHPRFGCILSKREVHLNPLNWFLFPFMKWWSLKNKTKTMHTISVLTYWLSKFGVFVCAVDLLWNMQLLCVLCARFGYGSFHSVCFDAFFQYNSMVVSMILTW